MDSSSCLHQGCATFFRGGPLLDLAHRWRVIFPYYNKSTQFLICFRIINMLPIADNILRTCASFCNRQLPLIKQKKL